MMPLDPKLMTLNLEALRDLIDRQRAERDRALRNVAEWEAALQESEEAFNAKMEKLLESRGCKPTRRLRRRARIAGENPHRPRGCPPDIKQ